MPGSKLYELRICAVIIALVFVEFCNLGYFCLCQTEVEDIQVIPNMINILTSGDYHKAHLCMPAEYNLCVGLSVFLTKFGKERFIDERFVTMSKRIPAHKFYIILIKRLTQL